MPEPRASDRSFSTGAFTAEVKARRDRLFIAGQAGDCHVRQYVQQHVEGGGLDDVHVGEQERDRRGQEDRRGPPLKKCSIELA